MAANQWFIPQGLDWAHCLAAYQFKGVGARKDAVIDLTSHGYDLTLSSKVEWSEDNGITGFGDGLVKQADLAQQNVVTTIIRYSGYATGGDLGDWVPNNQHASRMKKPFPMLRMIVSFKGHGSDDSAWHDHGGMHVGMYVDYATGSADPSGDWTSIKYTTTSVTPGSKGVLAWVKSGRIYKNGDLVGSGIGSDTGWPGATPKIEESNQPLTFFVAGGTINYLAAAFYDCALTESQIQDVTLAINNF